MTPGSVGRAGAANGFALLPVVLLLAVVGAVAFLAAQEGAHEADRVGGEHEAAQARYVAEAGLEHALWVANHAACASYALPPTPFGAHTYQATFTPTSGSPVQIAATGTIASGVARTLNVPAMRVYDGMTTTVLQPGAAGLDTYLRDGANDDNNFGASAVLKLNNASAEEASLLKFDFSGIPAGTRIESATLELWLEGGADLSNGVIDVHRVTQAWVEGDKDGQAPVPGTGATYVSYNGQTNWASQGGDYATPPIDTVTIPVLAQGWHQWDLTSVAEDWLSGAAANNGALLRASGGTVGKIEFTSGDGNAAEHPKLTVTYACECGTTCVGGVPGSPSLGLIVSTYSNATLGGLAFTDKDLVEYDAATDTGTLFLDGGALGIVQDIDAVHVLPNGHIVLSTTSTMTLGGLTFANEDLIDYDPVADTATLLFDGSARFSAGSTDISAVHVMANGHLLLTNEYDATLGGLAFSPNEIIEYNPVLDVATRFMSGNLVDLKAWINAVHLLDSGHIILSVDGPGLLGGLAFAEGDLVEYDPDTDTATLYFDGALFAAAENVRSVYVGTDAGGPAGVLAHWKLDDGAGPTALDSVGGHHGTLLSGPAWTAGALDGALDFDGVDDYVDVGSFDVSSGSGLTMMGWFYAENITVDDGRIVSKANGTQAADAWWQLSTSHSGSDRYLRMRIKAGGTTTTFVDSSVKLSPGQWYFAVGTYDAASSDMKLYLDGTGVASRSHAVGGSLDTDPTVPVAVGANGTVERFFDGLLDDVRIYDRALDASEIEALYKEGSGVPDPPRDGTGGYVEAHQTWAANNNDIWETVDLSGYGVPAGAVIEVAVTNSDASRQLWGGVRAVGSTLDRRLALHEAESGGTDVMVLHVQTDASGRIEHYADSTSTVEFVLLGYWTGGVYQERWDFFNTDSSASWRDHALAPYGVAAGEVAEVILTNRQTSREREAGARSNGSSMDRIVELHESEGGGDEVATFMVNAGSDSNATIEIYAEAGADVRFFLSGYWTTPPGTYNESFEEIGQPSSSGNWQDLPLKSFGVPPLAVAQIAMANGDSSAENVLGLRAEDSALARWLNLEEAESGGEDMAVLHVETNEDTMISWYDEDSGENHDFYLLGWWELSP